MIGTKSSKSRENGTIVEVTGRTGSTVFGETGIPVQRLNHRARYTIAKMVPFAFTPALTA
jgi:hypothetical protein